MTDIHVIFKAEKVSQRDWQIKCHCPEGKIDYVTRFLDEQSTQNWLKTEHRAHWLKVRGYLPLQELHTASGVNKLPTEDFEDMSLVYSSAAKR